MLRNYIAALFVSVTLIPGCSSNHKPDEHSPAEKKSVSDVIPITAANLRGHVALYDEGWFVITSSRNALDYANEKSVISSREAVTLAANSIAQENRDFADELAQHWQLSTDFGIQTFKTGTRITRNMYEATSHIASMQVDYGGESFQQSWGSLIKGNLYLGKRTEETRAELVNSPGNYFSNLREDFSNIYEITTHMQDDASMQVGSTWSQAFATAADSFNDEYNKSGQSYNAIGGLSHILAGYAKGLYQGLFKPTASTVASTTATGARGVAQAVFLPTATAISVSGRSIQAVGTTVYYTGKLGIEIISPTVEAGLLSGMAMLALGTAPLTYVTGASIGTVNQVAFIAAAPVAGVGSGVALTTADTGKYVAFVSYDALAGTSKVIINEASAAVVLGYNALTAIPTHAFMGVIDGAVFLAWDGPHLVIAYANGEIKNDRGEAVRVDSLPVGSVVDLRALEKSGAQINVLSDDPEVIRQVLEKLPDDLRE